MVVSPGEDRNDGAIGRAGRRGLAAGRREHEGGVTRATNAIGNPTPNDTDDEGLRDDTEVFGWNVTVVNTASGELYRYHNDSLSDPPEAGRTVGTVRFTSSALLDDTDFEGLNDSEEKTRTHTDPKNVTTYELTARNERFVNDLLGVMLGYRAGRVVGILDESDSRRDVTLTDATDDFDFVWDDTAGDNPMDRLAFRMVDGDPPKGFHLQRSDRWFSNLQEVSHDEFQGQVRPREEPEVLPDPWDPDKDDDGLTDGQGVFGLTRFEAAPTDA